MKKIVLIISLIIISLVECNAREIIDMAGRKVIIDDSITRVATVGSIPAINSFIFALGKGESIVSGLNFAKKEAWKYQQIFQPTLTNNIEIQGVSREILMEPLIKLAPQVIFTMDKATVEMLEKNNLPVVLLTWKDVEDVKKAIVLMGEIYHTEEKAKQYIAYFEDTIAKIAKNTPTENQPKVLFASLETLSTPHLIGEWWIKKSGGNSMSDNGRTTEKYSFSHEQIIAWNPDILIVENKKDLQIAYEDMRFSTLKAVKNRQVYVAPIAAHKWSNRTSELPLMVIWAANIFHQNIKERFPINKEMKFFYKTFYGYEMSDDEVKDILGVSGAK